MKAEIRQFNKTILSSDSDASIRVIFRNLVGRNFIGKTYHDYIQYVAIQSIGFDYREIEYVEDNIVKERGRIANNINIK